ncbi:MAG: hypothetical protein ABIQ35_10680 [Verrucomicrobiota bacterium]
MKPILQSCCWAAAALLAFSCDLSAATSERLLSITLTGVDQFVDQTTGDDVAIPFRITNRDILARITDATGTNVDNALLVVIDSLDDTNILTQIVARTAFFQVDVTDFFPIDQGESVRTVKYAGNNFRGATYFAIDHFQFSAVVSSPGDTNGIDFICKDSPPKCNASWPSISGAFERS